MSHYEIKFELPMGYVSSLGSIGEDADGTSPLIPSLDLMGSLSFSSFTVILGAAVIGVVEFKGFIS